MTIIKTGRACGKSTSLCANAPTYGEFTWVEYVYASIDASLRKIFDDPTLTTKPTDHLDADLNVDSLDLASLLNDLSHELKVDIDAHTLLLTVAHAETPLARRQGLDSREHVAKYVAELIRVQRSTE